MIDLLFSKSYDFSYISVKKFFNKICFSFIDRPEVEYKNPDEGRLDVGLPAEVEAVAEKQKENQHLLPKISTKNWIIIWKLVKKEEKRSKTKFTKLLQYMSLSLNSKSFSMGWSFTE